MDKREFLISSASVLSLSLTAGCGGPSPVGSWSLTHSEYADGSDPYDWPIEYSYDGNSASISAELTIDKELTGSLVVTQVYTYEGQTQTYTYSGAATATKLEKGVYQIEVAESDSFDEISMSCTIDDTMVCTTEDDPEFVQVFTFEPIEE